MSDTKIIAISAGDWASGVVGFDCEQEGFYFRFVRTLYQFDGRVPDDDERMAKRMSLSLRVYRRLKSFLVAEGKITVSDGFLSNKRVDADLAAIAERREKAREDGRKGAEARKEKARSEAGLPEVSTKFAGSLPEVSTKLGGNLDETSPQVLGNANEINDATIASPSPSPTPTPMGGRVEEKEPPSSPAIADPFLAEVKAAFNGSTDRLIRTVTNWDGVYGTRQKSVEYLSTVLIDYGSDAVLSAFRFVEQKSDQGHVRDPRAMFEKTLATKNRQRDEAARNQKPKPHTFDAQLSRMERDRREKERIERETLAQWGVAS